MVTCCLKLPAALETVTCLDSVRNPDAEADTCSTLPAAMTPRLTGAVALVPFTVMMAPDIAELVWQLSTTTLTVMSLKLCKLVCNV